MVERGGLQRHVPSGISLGDRITAMVEFGMAHSPMPLPGVVVYIHPEGRYFTVEFTTDKGSFRQAYILTGRVRSGLWGDEPQTNVYHTPPAGWISRQNSKQEETREQ